MCVDAILISTITGSISILVTVLFYNLRRSRCVDLQCACFRCTRQNMNTEEMTADKLNIPQI